MSNLINKLRRARAYRWLKLVDPVLQRFSFCPVWATYLVPPAPVEVDTSVGAMTITTAVVRSFAREYDVCEYSFPLTAEERVAFHPPAVVTAHYNELAQLAARAQHAFVAVIPDARIRANEWGEAEYDAFFFAPAQDSEPYDDQLARVAGVRAGLAELWRDMVTFNEYIPKFSRRAAWETGEKLVSGEWFAIKMTLNIKDYELTAM